MEVKEEATGVITDGDADKVDVESSTSASTTITPSLFDRTNEDKRAFQQELDRRFDDKRRLVENTTLDGREPKCTFWGGETGILGPTQIPTDIDFTNTVVSWFFPWLILWYTRPYPLYLIVSNRSPLTIHSYFIILITYNIYTDCRLPRCR